MKRFAEFFIITCILVVSASSVATMRFQLGFEWPAALGGGAVAFGLLMMLQMQSAHRREQERHDAEIGAILGDMDRMRGAVEGLERRLVGLELAAPRRGGPEEIDAVVAEIEVIGALVKQVVETVAELEARVANPPLAAARTERAASDGAAHRHDPEGDPSSAPRTATTRPGTAETRGDEHPLLPKRFAHLGQAGFLDLVRRSIEGNRIDIYLQPIVTLPQRRIRYYEALTRLRTEDGETIYPSDYIPLAEAQGIMPALDNQILFRTVQILKRLSSRAKEIGLFCNISATSLSDPGFFREFVGLLEANRSISDTLVFEFTQRALRVMGPIEYEALASLTELGFRFSVDQVTDLKPGFQLLAERGFRFAKISSGRILQQAEELGTDIHPADLANYFARFGIDLIVDHIESESQVVDLLDYGTRYGQGYVFSPPRPVRIEILQPAEARSDPKPAAEPAFQPRSSSEARSSGEARPVMEPRSAMEPKSVISADRPTARRAPIARAIAQRP